MSVSPHSSFFKSCYRLELCRNVVLCIGFDSHSLCGVMSMQMVKRKETSFCIRRLVALRTSLLAVFAS